LLSAFPSGTKHNLSKKAIGMMFLAVLVTIAGLCFLPPHGTEAALTKRNRFPGINQHPAAPIVPNPAQQFYQDYVSD
jgi:hypothetical protein